MSYRFSLPPSVRLYWVEASMGKRLLPAGLPTGGDDRLHVEVHAIRFDGRQPGPLMRMDLVMEPPREPGASVTIDVSETPEKRFALVPRVQIDKPAPAVPRPSAPVAPGPAPGSGEGPGHATGYAPPADGSWARRSRARAGRCAPA